ncbi:hypothetical protein J2X66_005148 [Pseudomonas sp. 3296]|uniref:hypothetical protein n=1 Tax=Pseudomonas sp. 3296 TaxID=2817753 RepID=UPI00285A0FF4|nr:hypothetical protein [Pseudomonas sp. 3296]MDR6918257.1 hypothetical protein [Pseudomonas sp. 3296]
MNLFDGMENFISDTEFNIKQKMVCRMCFCIALAWVVAFGRGHIRFLGDGLYLELARDAFARSCALRGDASFDAPCHPRRDFWTA